MLGGPHAERITSQQNQISDDKRSKDNFYLPMLRFETKDATFHGIYDTMCRGLKRTMA